MLKSLALIVSCFIAVALTGCAGATPRGTHYQIKIDRELQSHVPADLETAHVDALHMLENDYRYEVYHEALDAREGIIEATTAKNRRVRIETYYVDQDITRVEVFVTPFGDQYAQVDIFSSLESRLAW